MFVGLCGFKYSGRKTLANILKEQYGFTIVCVDGNNEVRNSGDPNEKILNFARLEEMLEYVTERWREDFVWPELETVEEYEMVSKRPFFLLIEVKARLQDRFVRSKYDSMAKLIEEDDSQGFRKNGLLELTPHAGFKFLNCAGIVELAASLRHLELNDFESKRRLTRPDWDAYFMQIAEIAAKRTNCMKRGVGAVLVQDRRIVASGYNGTARGLGNCFDGGCGRCNSNTKCGQALDSCLCLHAEENALLEAGRARSTGATLYCTTAPCLSCARKICQMAIARVVYRQEYSIEHFTAKLCKEAGIVLEKFDGNIRGGGVVINCSDENQNDFSDGDALNIISNLSLN